jgi:hypothetical protein
VLRAILKSRARVRKRDRDRGRYQPFHPATGSAKIRMYFR